MAPHLYELPAAPGPQVHWAGRPLPGLAANALRRAGQLRALGLQPGDRVATFAANGPAQVEVLLAHHRLGLIHVPINPGYQERELAHVLEDSGAQVLWVDAAGAALLERLPGPLRARVKALPLEVEAQASAALPAPPRPQALALLIYTSGTTGRSKGCAHTFAGVEASVRAVMAAWEVGPSDTVVHALPLFHVHGLCLGLQGPLLAGARVALLERFSPASVVEAFAAGGTVFMGVPTMYRRLIEHLEAHPGDAQVLARGRLFCAGSAALSPSDFAAFERLTGHRILERYGMSETLITLGNPLRGAREPGTVGFPFEGTRIRVVDAAGAAVAQGELGELQVQTPGMLEGYWGNPAATEEAFVDGWFKTGDTVAQGPDGRVRIAGRTSTDILKVGGYKLSALEIEEAIGALPQVAECAVLGLPDAEWGEQVVACVVLRAGAHLALPALQAALALQEAKKPRRLVLLPALPRNALGKVQKQALRAALTG